MLAIEFSEDFLLFFSSHHGDQGEGQGQMGGNMSLKSDGEWDEAKAALDAG